MILTWPPEFFHVALAPAPRVGVPSYPEREDRSHPTVRAMRPEERDARSTRPLRVKYLQGEQR